MLKMARTKVTMEIDKEALEMIDKASKKEFSSRSSFITRHSVKQAREILENN